MEGFYHAEEDAINAYAINKGKIIADKLNEKKESLYYTNIGTQAEEIVSITNKIFAFIEMHTDKAKELNKFIKYYMPTTLELLNNYENIEGEDEKSSQSIENAMNNLALALRHQLDMLSEEKILDIDSEIDVLNHLLRMEGVEVLNDLLRGEDGVTKQL